MRVNKLLYRIAQLKNVVKEHHTRLSEKEREQLHGELLQVIARVERKDVVSG